MFGLGKTKEYQLVIEFSGDSPENFQRIADFELFLDENLKAGCVDGNDVGLGIINLFIITEHPGKCFEEIMTHFKFRNLEPSAAGYRNLNEEDYVRLWPQHDKTVFQLR